ncbi:MAG: hypothetical protein ACQESJ_01195 [Bacteroidota bacterium]
MTFIAMHFYYLAIILFFIIKITYSQEFSPEPFHESKSQWKDSSALYFEFSNTNFFKNNEYFNDIIAGYTLTGFNATPSISYHPSEKTKITAGGHFLKLFGDDGFHDIKPVFTVHQKFNPNFSFLIGTIDNSKNHSLIRPLYDPELLLTDPTQYGFQFLFKTTALELDLWLDWQRFIHQDSPFRERFITGLSSKTHLLAENNPFKLYIPLQIITKHKGGQINNQDKPVSTLINSATGIVAEFPLTLENQSLQLENYITGFNKLNDKSEEPYKSGLGYYSKFIYNIDQFSFNAGYWRGSKFLSVYGDPIYQSFSIKNDEQIKEREILEGGFNYSRSFSHVTFSSNIQMLYDTYSETMDYYFGIYLFLKMDRFILKP